MGIPEDVPGYLVSEVLVLGKLSVVDVLVVASLVFDGFVVRLSLVRDGPEVVTVVGRIDVVVDGESGSTVTVVTVVVVTTGPVSVVDAGGGGNIVTVVVVVVRSIPVVVVGGFRWRFVSGVPGSVEHSSLLKREIQ